MTAPTRKFSAGPIACAVWQNEISVEGRLTTLLRATVERRYKDRQGIWKSSGHFGRNDIPHAIFCLQKAFEYMNESTAPPLAQEVLSE